MRFKKFPVYYEDYLGLEHGIFIYAKDLDDLKRKLKELEQKTGMKFYRRVK